MTNTFTPGYRQHTPGYRQHIIAAIRIAGRQPAEITTHGGGPGAEGSHITAAFGQQLMITMYDLAAAKAYIETWTADKYQWIFTHLPAAVPTTTAQVNVGPALSVRANGHDTGTARYDSPSGTAIVRIGSLTWTIQDRAAADSMIEAWQYLADLAPVVLSRQVRIRRR